jgi:rRNA-processing protein FCF1|tara:strand:+ start:7381 stop:7779 length:399 start_codon:yes stop_codon:yes gene_type:complete
MEKVLLDTNFLMACSQFKVDIFAEFDRVCDFNYGLFVLDKTVEELEGIIETQKSSHKNAAKVALQLLKLKKVDVVKTGSKRHTDDIILDYAEKGYLVATQDKDLKRRLINLDLSVIVLRQKKVLAIVNDKGF